MCGVAGTLNSGFDYQEVIQAMGHRGPDEHAGYKNENVDFFHLRLSILDIASGKQPMSYLDRYVIIFNGEIYNHAELRKQFCVEGTTTSDTETLLLLYDKLGPDLLQHLDGMFVFIIHDQQKKEIFIARDRAGKKPFYYYKKERVIAFASELNCLRRMVTVEIDHEKIYQYLRLGSMYRAGTPYKNVSELEGGCYLRINCETAVITRNSWWNINDFYRRQSSPISLAACMERTDSYLHSAVKRRIESSDLEVGSFLSGGIDSGLVTAIAANYNNHLKTFTVSFEGEYDEAPLARLVAERYNTQHTEIRISFENLEQEVEHILCNYGEPFFDSSAIPSYYVSREAKKHVTVILNGDGADELFGGYRRYVPFAKFDFFRQKEIVRKSFSVFRRILPLSHNRKSLYNYLFRLAAFSSKSQLEIYLSAGVDIFEDYTEYLIPPGYDYLAEVRQDFETIAGSNLTGLKKIMNLDFNTNLFDDLLVKMDVATMANSLEGRSPFLCKELLEFAPVIPDQFKIRGNKTKVILRNLARKYLPEQLINQPKMGFEIPLKKWIDADLKEIISDYLRTPDNFYSYFVKENFVYDLLDNKVKIPAEKRAKILWTLFALEVWYHKSFDNA
ncbi:asparagine synthase (glutamine-hydrolyzing) [soil metagenome]